MMKKTVSLVKTQLQIYFKGSTFIMPLIVSVIFLYTMYTIKPQQIVSSYLAVSYTHLVGSSASRYGGYCGCGIYMAWNTH